MLNKYRKTILKILKNNNNNNEYKSRIFSDAGTCNTGKAYYFFSIGR